jgi:hypothetical protein
MNYSRALLDPVYLAALQLQSISSAAAGDVGSRLQLIDVFSIWSKYSSTFNPS